jgi:hypothetical protein
MNLEATLADGVTLETVFKAGTVDYASSVAAGANTVGADKSAFANWTWASQDGQLADFK